jgi:hypothetical protein
MFGISKSKIVLAGLWLTAIVLVGVGASKVGSIAEAEYESKKERPDPVENLLGQGRYDEAIQLTMDENKQGVSDAHTYEGIALIYLERAKRELANRQRWAEQAAIYFDKATAAAPKDPFILESAMDGYNRLGDFKQNGCAEYQKGVDLGETELSLLQGTTFTVRGSQQAYPSQTVKEGLEPQLRRIQSKLAAWCKKPS